jgi:hypothetical protein
MKRIIFSLAVLLVWQSCSSDDTQETVSNFYALTVGNSWVYKNYKYNPDSGNYDDTGVIDSISIVGTETINEHTYFRFRRKTTGNETEITFCNPNGVYFELVRDSLGFLVTDNGSIKYINNNYEEHLKRSHSWGDEIFELQEANVQINAEAGNFECLDVLHFVRLPDNTIAPGSNNYYYADGIGQVMETNSSVANPIHDVERRLDTYIIN